MGHPYVVQAPWIRKYIQKAIYGLYKWKLWSFCMYTLMHIKDILTVWCNVLRPEKCSGFSVLWRVPLYGDTCHQTVITSSSLYKLRVIGHRRNILIIYFAYADISCKNPVRTQQFVHNIGHSCTHNELLWLKECVGIHHYYSIYVYIQYMLCSSSGTYSHANTYASGCYKSISCP